MAVTILKPNVYLPVLQPLLRRQIVLPRFVTRKGIDDFRGKLNDTVNVKIGASTTARTVALRTSGAGRQIITDTLTQTSYPVALSTKVYNAIPLTDEELTLDITDFATEVLEPQSRAIAEQLEAGLATLFASPTYKYTLAVSQTDAQVTFNRVLRYFNEMNIPDDGSRIVVVGSAMAEALRNDSTFRTASAVGDSIAMDAVTRATLRDANGMRFVESNAIDPYLGYALHPSAFIMASGAPSVPRGAVTGATSSYEGFAMRTLMDYDADFATDRSVIESWVGYKAVTEVSGADSGKMIRAIKLTLAPYGS